MKYFIAFALIAVVASAAVRPTPVTAEAAKAQKIIAAILSPSTDPSTAAALEHMLLNILGVFGVDSIPVGPATIPFPLPVGGALVEEAAVVPAPVVVAPTPAATPSGPLVQIILNINQAAESSPIGVAPVDIVAPEIKPEPVHVVESAPEPVQVVEIAPEPVEVVEIAPVPIEPIQIGVPVLPEPAVVLPEELN